MNRLIPPLGRQLISNLLWLSFNISEEEILNFINLDNEHSNQQLNKSLNVLFNLKIFLKFDESIIKLNENFKSNMKLGLIGQLDSLNLIPDSEPSEKDYMSIESLDLYATNQWEMILHYMVGSSTNANNQPSKGVLFLLERSGLIGSKIRNGKHQITSKGFQFLLNDVQIQLWNLLLEYLNLAEIRQMDSIEVLSFFFLLGNLELGKDYKVDNLTNTQQAMLSDLRDYGLVYQRKSSSKRFYPTRLATTLTSSAPPLLPTSGSSFQDSNDQNNGFIILETNYRLYAYTSNPLQISILNLFVSMKTRFPNLVIGVITRESIRSALSNGITAEQIIGYLTSHAHSQMYRNTPLLPVTVSDQIRLWELEKNRLKADEGVLYSDFRSQADYEILLNYAKNYDCVLWSNDSKRLFFITLEGNQVVREYVKRIISNNNGRSNTNNIGINNT